MCWSWLLCLAKPTARSLLSILPGYPFVKPKMTRKLPRWEAVGNFGARGLSQISSLQIQFSRITTFEFQVQNTRALNNKTTENCQATELNGISIGAAYQLRPIWNVATFPNVPALYFIKRVFNLVLLQHLGTVPEPRYYLGTCAAFTDLTCFTVLCAVCSNLSLAWRYSLF